MLQHRRVDAEALRERSPATPQTPSTRPAPADRLAEVARKVRDASVPGASAYLDHAVVPAGGE